jgi:hypothetical protein
MIVAMVVVSVIAGFKPLLASDICLGFFLMACCGGGVGATEIKFFRASPPAIFFVPISI